MHLHLFLPYCWQRVNLQELSFVFESSVVLFLAWSEVLILFTVWIYIIDTREGYWLHYWMSSYLNTTILPTMLWSNLLSIRSFKACACQIIVVLSPLYYRGAVNGPMQVSWYMGTGISPNTITAEFFHSGCKTSLCWDMERISLEELVY